MSNPSTTLKNAVCTAFGTNCIYGALADSSGTEMTGGSPAYARIAESWGSPSAGAMTGSAQAFNIASGSTPARKQEYTASTGGSPLDWIGITSQVFSSQGVYTVTPSYSYA